MILEEMSMKEFEGKIKKCRTVIIPFGSLEAHGPHLPLGTDTIEVYEIAKQVARSTPVFVAPPLPYGVCRSTRRHPGTVGISPDTLRQFVKDVVKNLYDNGLRRFAIISGHASSLHLSALQEAGEALLEEMDPRITIAVISAYEMAREAAGAVCETDDDSHAGEIETSLMLHLSAHLVRGRAREEYPSFPHPILTANKRKYWKNAVWGNPAPASAAKGKIIADMLTTNLVRLVKRINAFTG